MLSLSTCAWLVISEKDFVAIVDLPEGMHEYKFLVDGEWKVMQGEAEVTNTMGTKNNVITISDTDFEEFENALLRDPNDKSEDADKSKEKKGKLEGEWNGMEWSGGFMCREIR